MAGLHNETTKLDGNSDGAWRAYVCGHCGTNISGAVICMFLRNTKDQVDFMLCPRCQKGSVYIRGEKAIYPGISFGPKLQGLPEAVESAYEETRRCMSVNAFTAAELVCRKILMHVAVDKGASQGEPFAYYLNYLEQEGYITPPIKKWVNQIRENGNEATHELKEPTQERAEMTLMFTSQLLRLIYEMKHIQDQYLNQDEEA